MEGSEEKNEFIIYEDTKKDREEERIENSQSDIEMISDQEYMLECARFGELEDLKKLFEEVGENNLDVNYQDEKKNTALHMASANGHIEIVKYLVEKLKCGLDFKNYAGNTPLHWASFNGQKDTVVYLVEKGADFMIKNNKNKLPAEEAFDKQFFDISEFLVDKEIAMKKSDINIIEESGKKVEADPDNQIDLDEKNLDQNLEKEANDTIDKVNINK